MVSQAVKNKRDGTKYESDLVKYFRERGCSADRVRLSGKEDEGDIFMLPLMSLSFVIEAKAGKNVRPRAWHKEAQTEAKNYAAHRNLDRDPERVPLPLLAMKSHGKSIGQSLVTLTLDDLMEVIERATD